jgi:hypothetical protein
LDLNHGVKPIHVDINIYKSIGNQIGMVQFIDNLEFEKVKMLGPKIKVLVEQLDKLFQLVILLHVDKEGDFKLQLIYKGLLS